MNTCPNCNKPYQAGDEVCRTCGFILPITSPVIATGEVLQTRYEIQELVHSGGMGYVYLATDKRLYDRFCIIKQVKEPIKSEAHRKKLEEEALRMSKLNHPNVAMILDHFIHGGHYFLVVERIYGKTLNEVLRENRGHLTEQEVVSWAVSICDVVSYLHSEGIVHRDISPDNIMLTGDGSIKFIDFGTLREFKYIAPGGTVGIGKYGYTPPEQWQGKPEPRSDIFSLGATIYYLLTGFLPLSREYTTRQAPQKEDFNPSFPPIRTKNPAVSPQLEAALHKALQLDVNDRYPTVEEFGEALRNLERVEVKKVEVKRIPVLKLETRRLDFSGVKHGSIVTRPFILRNTGTDKLTGKLATTQPWLKVSPQKIDLKKGEWTAEVTADTRRLAPGFHGAGEISVTTNGGQEKVVVDLSIAAEARPEPVKVKPKPIVKLKPVAKPKPIIKPKPISISKPKAIGKPKLPLRWVFISLGIVLFLIAGGGGVYFVSNHPLNQSPTSPPPTEKPPPVPVDSNPNELTNFEDDFSDSKSGWDTPSGDWGEIAYENGAYSVLIEKALWYVWGSPATRTGIQKDFTAEVDVRMLSQGSDDAAGIVFRIQQGEPGKYSFYVFWINNLLQTYAIQKYVDNAWTNDLQRFTPTNYINGDANSNRLKVVCKGSQIEVYINGNKLTTVTDTSLDSGYIGLGVMNYSSSNAHYHFDNFKLYAAEQPVEQPPPTEPPSPAAEQPAEPPPPAELSFSAKTYTNDKYGFSIQYPKDWEEDPAYLTPNMVVCLRVEAYVPIMYVSKFDATGAVDEVAIKDMLVKSSQADPKVKSALKEVTLSDGTKATMCDVQYLSATGYDCLGQAIVADKGANRIFVGIHTVEAFLPYDKALATQFSQILHTLRFTQ